MGEKQNQPFQLSFNTSMRVDSQGSRVTSDGGLLLVRELDERLGLSALIIENIMDDRRGKNIQLPLPDTDGIGGWWSSQQRNLSTAGWGKERCCKSRPQMGQFWAEVVWVADRRECSR
jgi:hypothetical protein